MKTICVVGLALLMSGCVSFTLYESSVKATPGAPSPTAVDVETASMSPADIAKVLVVLPLEKWFTGWAVTWKALIEANQKAGTTTKFETERAIFKLELKR